MTPDHIPEVGKMMPTALMLAALFERYAIDHEPDGWPAIRQAGLSDAAAELRRLQAEIEATDRQVEILTDELHNANADVKRFREAAHNERETRRQLERHVEALHAENELLHTRCQQAYTVGRESGREDCEALLRQALGALEYYRSGEDCHPTPASQTITAIEERLK